MDFRWATVWDVEMGVIPANNGVDNFMKSITLTGLIGATTISAAAAQQGAIYIKKHNQLVII